jgi:hypothetical protein
VVDIDVQGSVCAATQDGSSTDECVALLRCVNEESLRRLVATDVCALHRATAAKYTDRDDY